MIMAAASTSTPVAAPAPKAGAVKCDVPGCGMLADRSTDGNEIDEHPNPSPDGTKRPSVKNINVCMRHRNWPHSDDAKKFAMMDDNYKARK
jgi:hypothetical protein